MTDPDNVEIETVNDAPPEVALEATLTRAEQPTEVGRPVEPAPMLGGLPDLRI